MWYRLEAITNNDKKKKKKKKKDEQQQHFNILIKTNTLKDFRDRFIYFIYLSSHSI